MFIHVDNVMGVNYVVCGAMLMAEVSTGKAKTCLLYFDNDKEMG